ncbi:MAG: hypothetical protein WC531_01300 [Candidatus Paceibacterota bacterium]|jgi:hypothetical protein
MQKKTRRINKISVLVGVVFVVVLAISFVYLGQFFPIDYQRLNAVILTYDKPVLDVVDYDRRMFRLANNPVLSVNSSTTSAVEPLWPVEAPYPKVGAILPFKRVIAYYGNLYSKGMGILGEYPSDEVLRRLDVEVTKWELADPDTPVQPALHYIAVTAQESAGEDGKYRLRMPFSEIDKVLAMAKKANAIVFLDLQVGLSNLPSELSVFEKYLKLPQVHLGLDPEFSMKTGKRPGTVIGTFDASDINYAVNYLTKLVKENNLPPKILVVHRFTQAMVTNAQLVKPLPEVQVVMDMDGWGAPAKKLDTYQGFVASEPVQFTGFKLFYKNDLKQVPNRLMTPAELLALQPRPIYIQYQ